MLCRIKTDSHTRMNRIVSRVADMLNSGLDPVFEIDLAHEAHHSTYGRVYYVDLKTMKSIMPFAGSPWVFAGSPWVGVDAVEVSYMEFFNAL